MNAAPAPPAYRERRARILYDADTILRQTVVLRRPGEPQPLPFGHPDQSHVLRLALHRSPQFLALALREARNNNSDALDSFCRLGSSLGQFPQLMTIIVAQARKGEANTLHAFSAMGAALADFPDAMDAVIKQARRHETNALFALGNMGATLGKFPEVVEMITRQAQKGRRDALFTLREMGDTLANFPDAVALFAEMPDYSNDVPEDKKTTNLDNYCRGLIIGMGRGDSLALFLLTIFLKSGIIENSLAASPDAVAFAIEKGLTGNDEAIIILNHLDKNRRLIQPPASQSVLETAKSRQKEYSSDNPKSAANGVRAMTVWELAHGGHPRPLIPVVRARDKAGAWREAKEIPTDAELPDGFVSVRFLDTGTEAIVRRRDLRTDGNPPRRKSPPPLPVEDSAGLA